jgi:biotin transport system substrate-specific component
MAILVLLGTGLLTLSAKVQVPFYPVPMTLQTLVVLLLGLAYGSVLGAATVLAYLAEGALGLPVFAGTPEKGLGLAYMLGPTGGYLLGFALAAGVAGWIAEHRPSLPGLVSAVAAGTIAIYVPGLLWLATFVGIEQAIAVGLVPFVWADLAKGALAVALGTAGWALLRKRVAP